MRVTTLGLVAMLAVICSGAVAGSDNAFHHAIQVLEKTKTVKATYSLYVWNRITLAGSEPVEEWGAEFHSGNLHRVETPRDRVVADCSAHTGAALSLLTGKLVEGPQVASAACGINTNASIVAVDFLGPIQSAFGEAQRVRVIDRQHVREYDVSDNGVLLRTTYSENRPGGNLLLTAEAVALEASLPDKNMFDQSSLEKSFVPEKYQRRFRH